MTQFKRLYFISCDINKNDLIYVPAPALTPHSGSQQFSRMRNSRTVSPTTFCLVLGSRKSKNQESHNFGEKSCYLVYANFKRNGELQSLAKTKNFSIDGIV